MRLIYKEMEVLDTSNWGLEMVMLMSQEGDVLWKTEDSKMFRDTEDNTLVFYDEERVFELMMSISRIRLTRNVQGDLRGMWQDNSNQWWERFFRLKLTEIQQWEEELLVFFYVDKYVKVNVSL